MVKTGLDKINRGDEKMKICEIEKRAMDNKAHAYQNRNMIKLNRLMIEQNQGDALDGNIRMANVNTEDIFKRMRNTIKALPEDTDLKKEFKKAILDKVELEFLAYKSRLNADIISINKALIEANKIFMEIDNKDIQITENIINFNTKAIAKANEWLNIGIQGADNPTPEDNAKLVAANKEKILEIEKITAENYKNNAASRGEILLDREKIRSNAKDIYDKRGTLESNRAEIETNADIVAAFF
jgi:hypothetical protein